MSFVLYKCMYILKPFIQASNLLLQISKFHQTSEQQKEKKNLTFSKNWTELFACDWSLGEQVICVKQLIDMLALGVFLRETVARAQLLMRQPLSP